MLASLGRTHDPANVERAVAACARSGMPTFNLDLIYGAAGESLDDWHATVDAALALDPPHVSAYGLTVEAGTPLATSPIDIPTTTTRPTSTSSPTTCSTAAGLVNYEVSNWARPGHECRHNLLYWQPGRLPGLRLCGALAPIGSALVERAHARALHRADRPRWRRPRPRRRRSTTRPAASRACSSRCEPVTASMRDAFAPDALELLDAMVVDHPTDPTRVVLTRRGRLMANEVSLRLR